MDGHSTHTSSPLGALQKHCRACQTIAMHYKDVLIKSVYSNVKWNTIYIWFVYKYIIIIIIMGRPPIKLERSTAAKYMTCGQLESNWVTDVAWRLGAPIAPSLQPRTIISLWLLWYDDDGLVRSLHSMRSHYDVMIVIRI